MRDRPTWRIPVGILALLAGLIAYALGVLLLSPLIERLPVLVQTIVYLVLGIVWLLPLRRFLIWMETGHLSPPEAEGDRRSEGTARACGRFGKQPHARTARGSKPTACAVRTRCASTAPSRRRVPGEECHLS